MSVKVHEAFSIDSFQDRLLWYDDFLGDQLQDEWRRQGFGTSVVVDAQIGGIVRLTSGALTNNNEAIDWNNIRSLHINQKVTLELRAKIADNLLTQVTLALFFDASNLVQFRINETTGVADNWFIWSINGGANTNADTGILSDTDYHIYRIECFPTDEVHFYIDGVETTNSPITTNIPDDAADFLQPRFTIFTNEDANKTLDIDYVVIRQEI